MEQPDAAAGKRKRRALALAFLLAAFLSGAVFSLLPGGFSGTWHRLFSLFGLSDFSQNADGAPMALHVLPVGKADAILAECDGKYLLVDGGTPDRGEQVCRYLARRGVRKIDFVVNTHPDSDHIGGLKAVLEEFPAGHFFTPELPPDITPSDFAYTDVVDTLREKKIPAEHLSAGEELSLGKTAVHVLAPVRAHKSVNDNSIVLRLVYGGTSFLLMGDAEAEEENDLLESGAELRSDVLKVGHHGSKTSSTQAFLDAVRPRFAAVSVEADGNGLPDEEVLGRLSCAGAAVSRTDVSGTLLYLSDGKQIIPKTER
jgi:competence protein ComEC